MDFFDLGDYEEEKEVEILRQYKDLGVHIIDEMLTVADAADIKKDMKELVDEVDSDKKIDVDKKNIVHDFPLQAVSIFQPQDGIRELGEAFVAIAGAENIIHVYSLEGDMKELYTLEGHLHNITSLTTYQPKGQDTTVIISGSRDRSVRVWVTQTRKCFKELHGHKDAVWCVDVMQPEDLEPIVLSGGLDGNIFAWSMLRGEMLRVISCGDCAVFSIKGYLPVDGIPMIISGTEDNLVTVWSLESGEILKTLEGHNGHVLSLDVVTNFGGNVNEEFNVKEQCDDIVISGSKDKTIMVWSLTTGACLRVIDHHRNWVFGVSTVVLEKHIPRPNKDKNRIFETENDSDDDSDGGDGENAELNAVKARLKNISKSSVKATKRAINLAAGMFSEDSHNHEYIVDAAVVSCDKEGLVMMTSINTGGLLYTWRPHSQACTGIDILLKSDCDADTALEIARSEYENPANSNSDKTFLDMVEKRIRYDIPGRQNFALVTVGYDKRMEVNEIPPRLEFDAFKAYQQDLNGFVLPSQLVGLIPEEFRKWANVYTSVIKYGISVNEYFSHDSFAIFHQAIIDNRSDFLEAFLPSVHHAILRSATWNTRKVVKIESRETTTLTSRLSGIKGDVVNGAKDRLRSAMKTLDEFEIDEAELEEEEIITSMKSSYAPGWLMYRMLTRYMFGEDWEMYKESGASSLLQTALHHKDVACITMILKVWISILNQPCANWIDQCQGPAVMIDNNDLLKIAKRYPVIFQNFICSLKMQLSHPYINKNCNIELPQGKSCLEKASYGDLKKDIEFWHTDSNNNDSLRITSYSIPLGHCADLNMIRAYYAASATLDDTSIFTSDIGVIAIKYAWSQCRGKYNHNVNTIVYMVYVFALTTYLFSDSADHAGYQGLPLAFLLYNRFSAGMNSIWKHPENPKHFLYYYLRFKNLVTLLMDFCVILLMVDQNQHIIDATLYRICISFVVLASWTSFLGYFRPYNNTGPIASTIAAISYDIRFYMVLLLVILIGFSIAFWCLCSSVMEQPHTFYFVYPFNQTINIANQMTWLEGNIPFEENSFHLKTFGYYTYDQGSFAYSNLRSSFISTYIALAGGMGYQDFQTCGIDINGNLSGKVYGFSILLSIAFTLTVSITMVNVLIAIMGESYERLSDRGAAQTRSNQCTIMKENDLALEWLWNKRRGTNTACAPRLIHAVFAANGSKEYSINAKNDDEDILGEVIESTEKNSELIQEMMQDSLEETDEAMLEHIEQLNEFKRELDDIIALQ